MTIAHPWLLAAGAVALIVGYLLRSWAGRHNLMDVATDAALSTAWKTLRTRKMPGVPDEITKRMQDVTSQSTHAGKATKAAGYAVRHVAATVIGIAGLVFLGLGIILIAAGLFWP